MANVTRLLQYSGLTSYASSADVLRQNCLAGISSQTSLQNCTEPTSIVVKSGLTCLSNAQSCKKVSRPIAHRRKVSLSRDLSAGTSSRLCAVAMATSNVTADTQENGLARKDKNGTSGEAGPETGPVPRVLTVAGSDSGGGAGIQADLKACAARGVFCTTAITALTAQNTEGVQGVHMVPTEFLEQQLLSVLGDIGTNVVKTGMLPSTEVILTLCKVLQQFPRTALVVDPVLVATSGHRLADVAILPVMRQKLFPLADLVTPNLSEAAAIAGWDVGAIRTIDDMKRAAWLILTMGPKAVLIKGGHLPDSEFAIDILYDGQEWHELSSPRIATRNTHGTGCTLASAIAAELAKGKALVPAVKAAKEYLTEALSASRTLVIGRGSQGPINHIPALANWTQTSTPRERFKPHDLQLYAVTDPRMNARWERSMEDAVKAAIAGGATFLQIREKDTETGDFVRVAATAVRLAREAGVPLVINDRVDVALAVDADGVHVGQSDMPANKVRALLGEGKIIGVSTKTPQQVQKAFEDGADYVGVGGVYPTTTKEGNQTIGLDGLRKVCAKSPIPVVAIGGINGDRIPEVLGCGAGASLGGVAIVSAVFDQADVEKATQALKNTILECIDSKVRTRTL